MFKKSHVAVFLKNGLTMAEACQYTEMGRLLILFIKIY